MPAKGGPRYGPIGFRGLRTYPLKSRSSKVETSLMARPLRPGASFLEFIEALPDVLGARDLRAVASAIARARMNQRPVVLAMGAHPIKVGLSPLIIEAMRGGIITALATNGAAIVHDFEMAYAGETSEDVAEALGDGSFGMARETGLIINTAIKEGVRQGYGIGRSMGRKISRGRFGNKGLSIFAAAYELGLPATVHVAVGTDIVHMHPSANGAAIGEGSLRDFRLLASVVADLDGGVYINLGSAVLLPEVFLKALSMARNLGSPLKDMTTVNMDFIQHYRTRENVLRRPTLGGGRAYALTGHHEIMLPLLLGAVGEEMARERKD